MALCNWRSTSVARRWPASNDTVAVTAVSSRVARAIKSGQKGFVLCKGMAARVVGDKVILCLVELGVLRRKPVSLHGEGAAVVG